MTPADRAWLRELLAAATADNEVAQDALIVAAVNALPDLLDALDKYEKGDLWKKIQAQQAHLSKLERKYLTVKGDLAHRQRALDVAEKALRRIARPESGTWQEIAQRDGQIAREALARMGEKA